MTCSKGCGRGRNKPFATCCQSCPKHTSECDPRQKCSQGCGRWKNGSFSTCCKRCPEHTAQCDERQAASVAPVTPLAWTIGTYNICHPTYAVKWQEPPGIDDRGKCNWSVRVATIASLLQKSQLDIYLLQEVGQKQLSDLMKWLGAEYEVSFAVHPAREARDGTAVLLRRGRLELVERCAVPLPTERGQPYMCAAGVFVRDWVSKLRLVILSAHLYEKPGKSHNPEHKILNFLHRCEQGEEGPFETYDLAVWGGDCNKGYKSSGEGPPGFHHVPGGPNTHPPRQIDWIFLSPQCQGLRGDPSTEQFIESTQQQIAATGKRPSDHSAEAITFSHAAA
eukprot:TRINITY_DN80663_c0_g1_i1.p1 TRINITY_DN80663_c0_g1~~TRINITY_DN80663_c0_g1_i1.p1  ORF type:complete len:362 (-),score=34.11 TRINITY_DN80663_c0_g1_i1:154-1161(-)